MVSVSRLVEQATSNTKIKGWIPWKHAQLYVYYTMKALQVAFDNSVLVKHHAVT